MKTTRFTDEKIIGLLKQAQVGMSVKELCLSGEFSEPTFNKWRSNLGAMDTSMISRIKALEKVNQRLRKM